MPFVLSNHQSFIMLSKFKGCMLGVLNGDCLGKMFEGRYDLTTPEIINEWINNTQFHYTDDTAFTFDVAESLINNRGLDIFELARSFSSTYKIEPDRRYGNNIGKVLKDLDYIVNHQYLEVAETKNSIFKSAKAQFKGLGSFGNGGAMRIAPISLFYIKCDVDALIRATIECTILTHYNGMAVVGAILQALAIREALMLQIPPEIKPTQGNSSFLNGQKIALATLDSLINAFDTLGNPNLVPSGIMINLSGAIDEYTKKMKMIRSLLQSEKVLDEDITNHLGNGVAAYNSVPTALYLFLKSITHAYAPNQTYHHTLVDNESRLPKGETETDDKIARLPANFFTDALCHAVKLGGDTDTIASMTGSLVGAWIGIDHSAFPEYWKEERYHKFEGLPRALLLAEKLYSTITVAGTTHQNETFL